MNINSPGEKGTKRNNALKTIEFQKFENRN